MQDAAGRDWKLTINVAALRRAKSAGVNLSMAVEQLREFVMDDVFLCDALWAIVEPQAKELAISKEQFEASLDGHSLELARTDLWDALCEYYPEGKSQMLRAAIQAIAQELAKATADISSGSTGAKAS